MSSLIEYLRSLRKATKPGAEDTTDRLNFVWTPMLLILFSLVVFGKEFIGRPMHCIFSGNPQHHPSNFIDFAESYCWAHGTYVYSKDAIVKLTGYRSSEEQEYYWDHTISNQLLTYYQWVPFALLLQCIVTYLPKLIWQMICSRRFGSDIYSLVSLAAEAKTSTDNDFREQASRIADVIERMLVYNREFRNGRLQRMKSALYNRCNFLVPSKRMGTMLTLLYMLVKLLCLANAMGQLMFMSAFLGFQQLGLQAYGSAMLQHTVSARGLWQSTMLFPLHTLCYIRLRLDPGATNAYIGQCTLPVNILNEKIYIVLFFWFLMLTFVTLISIGVWLFRLLCTCNQVQFVKRFLHLSDPSLQADRSSVKSFVSKFLRHDGVFLVLILSEGSDKIITTEVVRLLYQRWRCQHRGRDLTRGCEFSDLTDKVSAADCGSGGDGGGRVGCKLPKGGGRGGDEPSTCKMRCTNNVYGIAGDESGLLAV
ncbi:hypothetical protein BOX15_Mlig030738g5 [Macrostomum lignano]|uniref:Innexin n=1 Tax=Macrostomum lignano TaxID=282301 RepID=A0A267FRF2_9PLAT|nr:hypothetical protein BOX15_Mlig030738g5 [Macrostomum lignano]